MYICQVKSPSAAAEAIGSVPSGPLGEFSGEVSIEFTRDLKWKILGIFSNPNLYLWYLQYLEIGKLPQKWVGKN